jgi:iron/zinc purple acid phosphatase-like protein C/calcineurin-like phosphoesterase family protein
MARRQPVMLTASLLLAVLVVAPAARLPVASRASASIQAQATVTVMAAGDISPDPSSSKDDDVATSNLILDADPTAVLTLGDHQYPNGELADFRSPSGYHGSWGRFKARTRPSPGNHDYADPGSGAAGYFGYFGPLAGDPARGYYSFDLGAWHIISLNSNCGAAGAPSCDRDSAQVRWLQADLEANSRSCTLAYWHHARFTDPAGHSDDPQTQYFWNALYAAHADVVLSGHNHNYQRFGALHPLGQLVDYGAGVRAFVVGTGGNSLYRFSTPPRSSSRYRDDDHYGVLRLTLSATSWSSAFHRTDGQVADPATAGCWQ